MLIKNVTHKDTDAQAIIDGSGNFVLSRNNAMIEMGLDVYNTNIVNWTIYNCTTRKLKASWEALKFIWMKAPPKIKQSIDASFGSVSVWISPLGEGV